MKQTTAISPLLAPFQPDGMTPLHRQLFQSLRSSILDGRLSRGTKLPSTRDLATELGVSRNTVLAAYDLLAAEGFVVGRTGAGTWVNVALPGTLPRKSAHAGSTSIHGNRGFELSSRGKQLAAAAASPGIAPASKVQPFRPGVPALDAFPVDTWARVAARRWRTGALDHLGYNDPAGYRPLREHIAQYLRISRGVRCEWEQVIIVGGSQHSLDLVSRLLLDSGDSAWIEAPGYVGVHAALAGNAVRTISIPVDGDGLQIALGIERAPDAKLVCVTPSHQYPTGATLSLTRRLALLEWANRSGSWILEDDYDSEFRYSGRPLEALQGLDTGGRVIYLGTFSKVLAPALRLGYLVVPRALVDSISKAIEVTARHVPTVEQVVLADFMAEGHFARHLRRMQALYAERQATLVQAVQTSLSDHLTVQPSGAGMHLVGWVTNGRTASEVARAAHRCGVHLHPFELPAAEGSSSRQGVMLGYAPFPPDDICRAVKNLADVLHADLR